MLDLEWVSGFISVKVVRPGCILKFYQLLSIGRAYFIRMESTEVVEENDSSNDVNESDLNSIRNEVSPALIYGKDLLLEPPILGSSYRAPDIPKKYIEPIVLDTSLPYVSMSLSITWYSMVCVFEAGKFKSERSSRLKSELLIVLSRNTFMTNLLSDSYLHAFENP